MARLNSARALSLLAVTAVCESLRRNEIVEAYLWQDGRLLVER